MPDSIAGADASVEEPKLYGNEATVYNYTSYKHDNYVYNQL